MSETGRTRTVAPALQNIPLRTETGKQLANAVMSELAGVAPHVDYATLETLETRILAALAVEDSCQSKRKR